MVPTRKRDGAKVQAYFGALITMCLSTYVLVFKISNIFILGLISYIAFQKHVCLDWVFWRAYAMDFRG